mgnify:CR=1 FL=1
MESVSSQQKIRVRLMGYDHKVLDRSAMEIREATMESSGKIRGPFPFPRKIKKFTVNRSPHIYKKARQQFEIRIFKRLIVIYNYNADLLRHLGKLSVPPGVDIDIKVE